MGVGVRSFLFDEGAAPRRVPWGRMCRLFRGECDVSFVELAGRRVRFAVVFLEFEDRRPARVVRTEFSVLYFDEHGCLDPSALGQQLRLIGECMCGAEAERPRDNVVDIRPRLARKLHRERFEWTPTSDELAEIIERCL